MLPHDRGVPRLKVLMDRELVQAILEGARRLYPKESILLLRGSKSKDVIEITDLVVPPLAAYGKSFTSLPLHMIPMDFSIVGAVHSHPSGNPMPSATDLNHLFGPLLMITAFPFTDETNIAVYNSKGDKLTIQVKEG